MAQKAKLAEIKWTIDLRRHLYEVQVGTKNLLKYRWEHY